MWTKRMKPSVAPILGASSCFLQWTGKPLGQSCPICLRLAICKHSRQICLPYRRQETRLQYPCSSPPPVAGYRLDNTVSITYLLSFWKYKQFLKVYKIILGLFEYIILKSSALFQTSILSLNLADCFLVLYTQINPVF